VTEPARFVHGGLDCGSADTSDGRNLVDRPIADTVTLYLKRHYTQDSSLPLSVVVPQIVRKRAGTAERAPAVARSLPVGRPLALTGSESAKHPAVGLDDLADMAAWGSTAAHGAPALDLVGKVRRLAVADPPLDVGLPEQPGRVIKAVHVGTSVDDIMKRLSGLTERLHHVCQCGGKAFDFNSSAYVGLPI
jgi:hypothetical protein